MTSNVGKHLTKQMWKLIKTPFIVTDKKVAITINNENTNSKKYPVVWEHS